MFLLHIANSHLSLLVEIASPCLCCLHSISLGLLSPFHSTCVPTYSSFFIFLPFLSPFHSICRVVWVFGSMVQGPIEEVTPTSLTMGVLSTLRQADYLAHAVLERHSKKEWVSHECGLCMGWPKNGRNQKKKMCTSKS